MVRVDVAAVVQEAPGDVGEEFAGAGEDSNGVVSARGLGLVGGGFRGEELDAVEEWRGGDVDVGGVVVGESGFGDVPGVGCRGGFGEIGDACGYIMISGETRARLSIRFSEVSFSPKALLSPSANQHTTSTSVF